ncbi:MAG TPA: copper homeostasis protein CutC [Bacteroidia bacterium]|jgi:copper homeostasis protein|nr:copper homeostasis protein CutC [Bacteroidia bacterium]
MLALEICCYSDTSVRLAAINGADRAELCGPGAGGTTPDEATMRTCRSIPHIKLHILIRPRTGDFCYSETEFEQMKDSVLFARQLGADGVVFGILNPDGTVDINRNRTLAALAAPMDTTFHKAFDECKDLFQALDAISDCGIHRILTSGGHPTALAGIDILAQLIAYAKGKIIIMAGGGIRSDVIHRFHIPGLHEIHSSAILNGDTADEKEIHMLQSSIQNFKKS